MKISVNRNKHVVMEFSFAEIDIFRKRLLISKKTVSILFLLLVSCL